MLVGTPVLEVTSRYSRDWNCPVAGHLSACRRSRGGAASSFGERSGRAEQRQPAEARQRQEAAGGEQAPRAPVNSGSPVHRLEDLGAHQRAARDDALQVDQPGQELQGRRGGQGEAGRRKGAMLMHVPACSQPLMLPCTRRACTRDHQTGCWAKGAAAGAPEAGRREERTSEVSARGEVVCGPNSPAKATCTR